MARPYLHTIVVVAIAMANCASAPAADNREAAVNEALAASAAAQQAALAALRAAHAALAASGPGERESAVRMALDAAAAARQAADTAQGAVASLRGGGATASPAQPAPAPATPTAATESLLSSADVTGTIKAGQADDTASIALTWSDESLDGASYTTVTFSAPTSSSSDITRLGTLDGLADAASAKLSYSRYFPVDRMHPDERFWAVGAAAKVGKKTYRYRDATSFAEGEASRKPASASVSAGYVPNDRLMVLGRFEAQRKYVAGEESVLCRPGTATPIECVAGPIGAPVRKVARIYTIGARYLGNGFSLAPSFNYDQAASVRGIDIPVYLIGAGDGRPGPLSGGIGASWRSDTRDTAFYVFVGSPFSFWGL